jgi:hypothetical protein
MNAVDATNQRNQNFQVKDGVSLHGLVSDPQSQALLAALHIFKSDWIEGDHLSDLRRSISRGYQFVRLPYFFSPSGADFLLECLGDTNRQIKLNEAFLGPEEKGLLARYLLELEKLSSQEPPWRALADEVAGLGARLLLVTEASRWANNLSEFVSASDRAETWMSVPAVGFLTRIQPRQFDALVFLGNPLEVTDSQARLIFTAGLSPKVDCWIPWPSSLSRQALETKLFGPLKPTISLPSFKHAQISQPSEWSIEFEQVASRVATRSAEHALELERLGTTGTEKCILLRIGESAVIPVEVSATRISTLVFDSVSGRVREDSTDWPLSGPGSIVFALVEQGEQDFLWNAAKVEMGDAYAEFDASRKHWLQILKDFVGLHGTQGSVRILTGHGVETASHLAEWLINEKFTRPRANNDFRALLDALSLDEEHIKKVMSLTSTFRGELNQVAKTARDLVCNALSTENWAELQAGETLDVLLEEFGDVVYRIGKVSSISEETYQVPASQVRRVVNQ